MDVVEFLRQISGQAPVAIAGEEQSGASSEYALVGGHPLHSYAMRNGQRLFRDAALRRPHAFGTQPENFLMQIQTARKLLTRIFRMPKPVLGQRQSRRRYRPRTGIAYQGQDRVIE